MARSNIDVLAILEIIVMLFQVCGVVALCLTRLVPAARWAERGRVVFIIAMVGLGVAGALCGRQDSEFALFAGGTMTALLIGMTIGNGAVDHARAPVLAERTAIV
jgi:uncharacterized membrane protein YcfT